MEKDDVITSEKLNQMQQVQGPKGKTGAPGKDGTNGKDGAKGADAKQIKAGVINEDKNGVVTGAKVTFTDNTTVNFSVNKATK